MNLDISLVYLDRTSDYEKERNCRAPYLLPYLPIAVLDNCNEIQRHCVPLYDTFKPLTAVPEHTVKTVDKFRI